MLYTNLILRSSPVKVWSTFWKTMAKWQNGYGDYGTVKLGYPTEWLEEAGFGRFAATHEQFDRQRADFVKAGD